MKTTSKTADIIRQKDAQIEDLKRQVNNLESMIFGSQSERQSVIVEENPKQLFLDFEGSEVLSFEDENSEPKPERAGKSSSSSKKKKKKGGNQLIFPENLETEDIHLDVADDEKFDPITGEEFSPIDEDVTEKLVRVKASYKLIRFIRPVYGARKNGIIKADLPQSVFGFSKLDESFWAEVLVRRTCDHLPFNRQVQILARDDINISRQCLNKTYINTGSALQNLGKLLKKSILSFPVIHVDETTIKMQMPGKKSLHTAYLWVLAGRPADFEDKEPLVWMDFKTNRKHENAEKLIEGFNKVMHSDIFQGYEKLADTGQFTWAPCWVHARRKFIKATENDFQKETIAKFTAIMAMDNEADLLADKAKVDFRQEYVKPMVDKLILFLEKEEITPKVMISKSLSNACSYFLKRKQHFKNFISHPKAEMDNNAAERSIRPLKVGNKNWLFIGSQAGGDACAVITSLLQSAKNIGLNPQEYIENVLRRLPYTSREQLHELLPHKWKKKINSRSPFLPPDYKIH